MLRLPKPPMPNPLSDPSPLRLPMVGAAPSEPMEVKASWWLWLWWLLLLGGLPLLWLLPPPPWIRSNSAGPSRPVPLPPRLKSPIGMEGGARCMPLLLSLPPVSAARETE